MSGVINAIVAISDNGIIGKNNDLPWSLPPDLKYFKEVTTNHTVVMGRKCYESIGRPLPNRKNVILTRDKDYLADGCEIINDISDIHNLNGDIFIIGGAEIYRQTFNIVDYLYITKIFNNFDGDTKLVIDYDKFKVLSIDKVDTYLDINYRFEVYEKIK